MNATRRNYTTTGRVGGVVYDLRHWKLTLLVGAAMITGRFFSGRDVFVGQKTLPGSRTTDATFTRGAHSVRRGPWANLPGAARMAIRLGVVMWLWAWFAVPALAVSAAVVGLAVLMWATIQRARKMGYERAVLEPVWPAVAGIIGVPESEPPGEWLEIQSHPRTTFYVLADADNITARSARLAVVNVPEKTNPTKVQQALNQARTALGDDQDNTTARAELEVQRDGKLPRNAVVPDNVPSVGWEQLTGEDTTTTHTIVVGLREADADDEKRIAALVTLFDQRYGVPHVGQVDYGRRLAHLKPRPPEPEIWPAVARAIGVPAYELAAAWLTLPADLNAPEPVFEIRLPLDLTNDAPVAAELKTLISGRFKGEWESRTDSPARLVRIKRKPPKPKPPSYFDYDDINLDNARVN